MLLSLLLTLISVFAILVKSFGLVKHDSLLFFLRDYRMTSIILWRIAISWDGESCNLVVHEVSLVNALLDALDGHILKRTTGLLPD